jgi:hypothetical protein
MSVITLEGVVEHGQIRLKTNVQLPENIKVFVVIPNFEVQQSAHIQSPRLTNPEEVADFKMEVIEDVGNASL